MTEMADCTENQKEDGDDGIKRIIYSHPLIRETDMTDELKNETLELCVTACEKYSTNNESAARLVKETMDKKYGASWHVVIGESYGLEVTHQLNTLLYMYFAGNLAICIWKCI